LGRLRDARKKLRNNSFSLRRSATIRIV
jgi:hypothetical protein